MLIQILRWSLLAGAATFILSNFARADDTLTVGHQTTVEPLKVAQVDGR